MQVKRKIRHIGDVLPSTMVDRTVIVGVGDVIWSLDFGNEVTTTSPRLPTYDILPRMPSEAIHTDELYS